MKLSLSEYLIKLFSTFQISLSEESGQYSTLQKFLYYEKCAKSLI